MTLTNAKLIARRTNVECPGVSIVMGVTDDAGRREAVA
jgi:hypothetical protein